MNNESVQDLKSDMSVAVHQIDELIKKISHSKFNHMTWVGKSFSIKDLLNELEIIKDGLSL